MQFKRKVMYPHRRTDEAGRAIDKLFKEYAAHLKPIRDSLPEGAHALSTLSFHDAKIKEVKHLSKREVQIPIEGDGYYILTHDSLKDGGYTLISAQAVQPQTVLQFYSLLPDEYFEDSQRISCVHD